MDDKLLEDTHNHINDSRRSSIELSVAGLVFFLTLILPLDNSYKLVLYILAYILAGNGIIINAFKGIFSGQLFDENFLMTIASLAAFFVGEYPEAVAVIIFYRVGIIFEESAINHSKKSITNLLDIKPDIANLSINGEYKEVSPDIVDVGSILLVRVGEKIPLDGIVINGKSAVDTSIITGESLPTEVQVNSKVYSGTINLNGVLLIKVSKNFQDSTVSKILELVKKANEQKADTEKFITKFAKYYTPAVVIIAILIATIPPMIIGEAFSDWIYRAAIFLVVSCPCALVISIPLGYFGGIGGASRHGILVKGGNYLEALRHVDTIVLDKTGTITKGIFRVNEVILKSSMSGEMLIEMAAHIEYFSNHPIARSVLEAYSGTISEERVKDIKEITGRGMIGYLDGIRLFIGNKYLMKEVGVAIPEVDSDSIGTLVYIANEQGLLGIIVISDEIKEHAKESISEMRKTGVKHIIMLTGDRENIAKYTANQIGIDEYFSELLPQDKVNKLEELLNGKNKDEKVIFVGDGINDAPVLARADVGVAMGGIGSDAAIEAADIVLMTDELIALPKAIKLAKYTNKIVWQNIVLALGVKGIILVLATIGITSMWFAVFADVGVAIIAILNAVRVIKVRV